MIIWISSECFDTMEIGDVKLEGPWMKPISNKELSMAQSSDEKNHTKLDIDVYKNLNTYAE